MKSALVVPVFNESARWNAQYWRDIQSGGVSLFFVNDGSSDNTSQLLQEIEGVVILNCLVFAGILIVLRAAGAKEKEFALGRRSHF